MTAEVFETYLAFRALSDDPDGSDGFGDDADGEEEKLDGEEGEEVLGQDEEEVGSDLGGEMNA